MAALLLMPAAFAMRVGTYNIRYDNPGDERQGNGWKQRAPIIADLIKFHDFDLLGTEEGLHNQMEDLGKLLPDYACSAHGRDDGKQAGEHIGIFYKKEMFDLLEDGCFWLSETPDQPSTGWDAALPRICGWAKLRRKADDKTLFVFGVHLDHRGKVARTESVKLMLTRIAQVAGDAPVFVLGDFNTDQQSENYRVLSESGRFTDAYECAALRYALNGTANKFDPNARTDSRIDHVFVSKGIVVKRYGVLTDSYRIPRTPNPEQTQSGNFPSEVKFQDFEARLPSDHFPVLIEVAD